MARLALILSQRHDIIKIDTVSDFRAQRMRLLFPLSEHRSDTSFNLTAHFQSAGLYRYETFRRAQFSRSSFLGSGISAAIISD